MYKKALSLLLALMLIVTSLSVALVTVAAAGEDGNASVVKVTATSNVFPESEASFTQDQLDAQNNKVTITYFIQSKLDMINADWKLTYDGTVLKCDEADNPNVMPHANGAFINFHPKSEEYGIKGNCTSLNAYDLEDGSGNRTAYVTVTFTVIGTGDTTVNLNVSDMLVVDDAQQETQLVNNSVLNSEVTDYTAQSAVYAGPYDDDYVAPTEAPTEAPATDAPATDAPATDAPATDAPATDAPATEPATDAPVVEDTLIVAGSEAEIFGTGWDGTNEANLMTKQDDGTYTKEYTVDKAYTAVQLKSVKNGAEWIGDETGNNVTFNLTGPGTFTVIYDPEANVTTVEGDIVEFITDFTYETVSAAGNGEGMWLNGASWDPAYVANEMTEVAEGIWEIEFTNVPDGFERQIKFCIDGAWTHNFGGAFEESGVATDAVYNGDNITFDTDDTCTVKAQLDLTNFDFTTKEGAKFTITITYDEEPTEAPATEAPATDAPATDAPATDAPATDAPATDAPATDAPATDAPATDAPATDAPATDAPADKFTVKGTSNFFLESVLEFEDLSTYEDENGNVFIAVEYSLDAPGKSLINADVALTWDKNVLEYKEAYNQSNGMLNFFPFAVEQGMGAGMVNTFDDSNNGRIRANYTNISPAAKAYDDITVVRAVFKVLDRTAGETVVNCYVDTISLDDDTATQPGANYSLVTGGVVDEELSKTVGNGTAIMTVEPEEPTTDAPATDAPATDAPATDAPATDAPATDAPTTEPVVEDTLIVAGSEAEIFGTAWDGTNETNLMTKQEDGTYTREYTVDKAYTAVQLKSVKNGAEWIGDETGNNVTFNLTGPGTFTVIYDPETNVTSVEGDIVEFITDFTYDTVYAAGNGEGTWLNGASWDPAYVGNEMTEVADDIWEIEFTDVPDGFERQIKFCIDGAWTHNFGGAFEESGVATDAVYNGDNITFDTDDTCTVKAQLDLTNFDFTTKEGAKFTITITYDEEPTEAPATEAPATEAPATEAPATDAPTTDAPATDAPATDAPATDAPGANLTVDGTSNYSPAVAAQTVKAGDTVTVTFKAPEDADIINIQWGMNYDTDKLELTSVSSFTPDMLVNTDATSFNAMGSVSNIDTPYSVWEDDDFVTFTFTAKADGETTVDFRVIDMTYREDDEDKEAFVNEVDVRGEEPVTEPVTEPATEPATDAPATDAPATDAPATDAPATEAPATDAPATEAPATEAPAGDLTVDGISNYSPNVASQTVKTGETVTVTFKAPEDANIVDVQWGAIFDTDKLELNSVSSFTADMLVNNNPESYTVMGSVSNITAPYSVLQDDDFVTFTFTAKADGETTVDFRVIDLTYRTDNGDEIAFENEVDKRGGEEPGTEPATEAPATEAPATEAPATEAPATEAPATEAPATEAPATEAPATEAPATEAPATEAPATEAPATEAPATEAPATEAPATEAPATEAPATEAPATEAPATEAPATEAPATEAPATEAPATTPEGVIGYAIVFPDGTTIDLERSDDGTFKTIIPEDRFENGKVEFKVVQKNDDNTTTDVLDNASYDATGKGNAVATYDFVNNTITLTFTGEEPPATSSTDATSATTPGGSTSDSGSTPDGGSNSGAVQTGNASMALIILLVLVSATAGIYFARKKVK